MAERDLIINLVVKGGDTSSQQLEKVAQSEQDIAVSTTQATKALDSQSKELQQNATAAANLTKQNQSLRGQLRAIQQELAKLALAGKANTAEYKRLRDEAGNLQDAIADAAAEIRQAGSDTRGLDKAIRVATTATAAFGLVQGAAALFGDENEELQKSLLKVNTALTVLTSLQQIQEELSRKDSVFTSLAAKAKAAYAAATAGASTALGAFRVALIATGIGAAVVAVGLLIANWDKLTAAFRNSTDALEDYNREQEKQAKRRESEERALNSTIQALQANARLLRAQGRIEEANATDKLALQKQLEQAEKNLAQSIENKRRQEESYNAALEKQQKVLPKIFSFNAKQYYEDAAKAVNQNEQALRAATRAYNEDVSALSNAKAALLEFENDQKKTTTTTQAQTKAIKEQVDTLDLLRKSLSGISEANQANQSISELERSLAEVNTQILQLEDSDPARSNLIQFSIELERQLRAARFELERIRQNFEATELVGPVIPDFAAEAEKQAKDVQTNIGSIFGALPAALKKAQDEQKTARQNEIQENIQQAQIIAEGTLAVFRQAQAARQQILDNRLKEGLITEQEYQEEVAKLRRKQAIADKLQAVFNATLSGIQAYLAALKFGPVFAGVVAALAAAQLAAIAATPIPKFRKGGDVDILKGGRERLGQLFGNSHDQGGILIEAEGGEHITRKTMAKKYRPLLHAINSDTVDSFLKPNTLALPMPKRLSNSEIKSSRQAEKRMAELIEEVRFLSQYVRQGNKYAKVTADTNTQMVNKKTAKVYV